MNEQIDFIGANLDSIQHVLANQQNLFDPMTLSDVSFPVNLTFIDRTFRSLIYTELKELGGLSCSFKQNLIFPS